MNLGPVNRIFKGRLIASAALAVVFLGVGLHGVIDGWHLDQPTPVVLLLLAAYIACPRRLRDKHVEQALAPERLEALKGQWRRRLVRARLAFFGVAVVVLALLPIALGEPFLELKGWVW